MDEPERREFVVTCGGPQQNQGVSRAEALEVRVGGGKERFKTAKSPSDGALSGRLLLAPLTVDAEGSVGDRAEPFQGDFVLALLAAPEAVLMDPLQRFLDVLKPDVLVLHEVQRH